MRKLLALSLILSIYTSLLAQMPIGQDTLYGLEWIQPAQTYLKFKVAEDGFYRITYDELLAQNWPVDEINTAQFILYHAGKPIYFHSTTAGNRPLASGDYLLFYGKQNRGELDFHLYRDPDAQQLNPLYSLHADTASYYLSWTENINPFRFETITNDLSNPPAPESYVWRQIQTVFNEHFVKEYARLEGITLHYSHMSIGEGYGNRSIDELQADGSTSQSSVLSLSDIYEAGPATHLRTRYVAALFQHDQSLSVNGTTIRRDSFNNWRMLNVDTALPADSRDGERLEVQWEGLGGTKDEVSVGFIQADYPAIPRWTGEESSFSCWLDVAGSRQFLQMSEYENSSAVLYDLENGQRMVGEVDAETLSFVLPAVNSTRQLQLLTTESVVPALTGIPVDLQFPEIDNANYLILTHSALRAEGDPVQAYADYRASSAGGNYRTAVINVDRLYDMFGYGVAHHPMAIRNFLAWQRKVNPNFEFLFLVGKGREYKDIRSGERLNAALGVNLFVPTFGYPGSDNLLASAQETPTPLVAIGRLAVVSPAQVQLYLRKIQDMEATATNAPQNIDGKSWMKQVLHLGGGATAGEQQSIRRNLEAMSTTLSSGTFGSNTTAFYKTSSDPIQEALTTSIFNRINKGVSVITFFGHSNANTFDFSIDNPENYANYGKYPLMLSLGCYSGNMHFDGKSAGERFILFPDKGASAFGASRGIGFFGALADFGDSLYHVMGNEYYGRTIGESIAKTIEIYENRTDFAYGALMEQFQLQGDPAIRLNPAAGADFVIDSESTKFEPGIVSLVKDSFNFSFDLYNLGQKAQVDSITLKIDQLLPTNEQVTIMRIRIPAPAYREKIMLTLPTQGRKSLGKNTLLLEVDIDNEVVELPSPVAESNNTLVNAQGDTGVDFFVIDNSAIPIWPIEFGIVGEEPVLKVSTANPLAKEQKYLFEISRSPAFTSVLDQYELTSFGGVLEWQPSVSWQDSTVYFWRVSPDSLSLGLPNFNWEESSFTYIESKWGWGQASWGQYRQNTLADLQLTTENEIDFVDDIRTLMIRNNIHDFGRPNDFPPEAQVNNRRWHDFFQWNLYAAIQLVVIDTVGRFWFNENPGQYGSIHNNHDTPIACFPFPVQTVEERSNIITFIEEVIPEGYTVLVYNAIRNYNQDFAIDAWAADSLANNGRNLFNVLESHGAEQIRELAIGDMRPYYFAFVKGGSAIHEAIATDRDETVTYTLDIRGKWTRGQMESVRIGPASEWNELSWKANISNLDSIHLKVYGVDNNGLREELFESNVNQSSINLSEVSPESYPYLLLSYYTEDRFDFTSPQLDYWNITSEDLPDLAINGVAGFAINKDTLQQGQDIHLQLPVLNTSRFPTDSTTVRFSISNGANSLDWSLPMPSTTPNELVVLETTINTSELDGISQLAIEVNPSETIKEHYRFNNQAGLSFYVAKETIQPITELAFDGVKILDGDLVSSEPLITIRLEDENNLLLLDESSNIQLVVTDPDEQEEQITLNDSRLNVQYPSDPNSPNRINIEWEAIFTKNGTYEIELKGQDRSGNLNGNLWLKQRFQVITENSISNFLPYPNPFTTNTRFVYTLTGSEPPARYRLQIMTVSGKIVREVSQTELGPLSFGTHLTEFTWDGTDDFGDELATGTYLYRFISEDEQGNMPKHYSNTDVDKFFNSRNGIGKIVILR